MLTSTGYSTNKNRLTRILLFCGILSSVWYVVINVFVPTQYDGYSFSTLTVSELSAIGAPTRTLWVTLVILYTVLFAAFGYGVLSSVGQTRSARVVGWLIIGYSIFNVYWPPMHQRGVETSLTDTLHLVWASVTVVLMIVMMAIASTLFGKGFRIYTIASIAAQMIFGLLTALQAPNIPTNTPTPTIGTLERINIGIFMLWVVILSIKLLNNPKPRTS